MKATNTLILFLIFSVLSFGNNPGKLIEPPLKGWIKGVVKEAVHKSNIEYANVALYRVSDSKLVSGTVTDIKGAFKLEKIPEGAYYLSIDFIGFEKNRIENIQLNRKKSHVNIGEILLKQANYKMDEVTLSAQKNYVDFKIDKKVVNVSQHANAAGGTVAEVLENVPSVQVDIEGNTSLRGSSSFTVLIDGKPSPLNGSEILKQIPANSVENIEIITNPSAKYDPEGTTGIINIIMKKGYNEGLNGLISLNYSTWKKVGGDLNLNLRKEKVNYFLVANYRRNPRNAISENNREFYQEDNTLFVDEKTNRKRTMRPFKINSGMDIYFNDKNTLTLSATYGGWGMDRYFESEYASNDQHESNQNYSTSTNDFTIDGLYYVANTNFQHLFTKKDHKIDINLAAWTWNSTQKEKSFEQATDASFNPQSILSNNRSNVDENRKHLQFKTDYTYPLKKGKIELGLDMRLVDQNGEVLYEKQDLESEEWQTFGDYSYQSEFYRNLFAAYATYSGSFQGIGFQMGLRGEKTERNLIQSELNKEYPVDLLKFYPSFHLSKQFNPQQQLQLSYSRRINRPQPWQLSPYPGYTDSYNYFQGNPLLKPEDTDAVEMNYLHRFPQLTFSTGLYYRQSFNSQEMVQDISPDNPNVVYLTFGNIDRTTAMGLEYMFNYNPLNALNINLSGNAYRFDVYSSFSGEEEQKNSINWDARLNTSYNLNQSTRLQFSGVYNGPSARGQGTSKAFYYFDLGIRKGFLNRKLNASLLVHNIFRTGKFETLVENEDFTSSFYYKGESPVVRLSLSYTINQYQRVRRSDVEIGAGAN